MADVDVGTVHATLTLDNELSAGLNDASKDLARFREQFGSSFSQIQKYADDLGISMEQAAKRFSPLREGSAEYASSAKRAADETVSLDTQLSALQKTLVALGIGKLVKDSIDFAGQLQTVHERTGITTDTLQRMSVAAVQTDVSMQQVATTFQRFQANLVNGNKTTLEAIASLGLEADTLKSMSIDDIAYAIADAVSGIPDPTERSAAAIALLGRSGGELVPFLDALRQVKDEAVLMSAESIAAVDRFDDTLKAAGVRAKAAVGTIIGALTDWRNAIHLLRVQSGDQFLVFNELNESVDEQVAAMSRSANAAKGHQVDLGALTGPIKDAATAQKEFDAAMKASAGSAKSGAPAIDKYSQILKGLKDRQADVVLTAKAWSEFVGRNVFDKPLKIQEQYLDSLQDVVDTFGSLKAAGLGALDPIYERLRLMTDLQPEAFAAIRAAMTSSPLQVAGSAGGFGGANALGFAPLPITDPLAFLNSLGLPSISNLGTPPAQGLIEKLFGTSGTAIGGGLVETILGALMGGGSVLQAGGSYLGATLSKGIVSQFGAGFSSSALGGILGSALPIVGSLLGPLLGKLFGPSEGELTNDLRDQAFGGMNVADFHKIIQEHGNDQQLIQLFERAYFADSRKEFEQFFGAFQDRLAELDAITAEFNAELEGLTQTALDFGTQAPASMQGYIDQLLSATNLTDTARSQLEALRGQPTWQELQAMAEQYGVSLDALGQNFQQLKSNDFADQLFTAFTHLTDAGADVRGVLEGMADEAQQLIDNSIKFGTEVPEYMRPMLEQMVAFGLLVDQNGQKLTDLSGIQFGEDIKSTFMQMLDVLTEIKNLLEFGLPSAAEAGAEQMRETLGRGARFPIEFDFADIPKRPGGEADYDDGGYGLLGGGTIPLLSGGADATATGGSSVPLSTLMSGGGYSPNAQIVQPVLMLDGVTVGRVITPYIADESVRLGLVPLAN